MPKMNIIFVYVEKKRTQGSAYLRTFQFSKSVQAVAGTRADISLNALPPDNFLGRQTRWAKKIPAGTFLFLSKASLPFIKDETLDLLGTNGVLRFADYLDTHLDNVRLHHLDGYICAAMEQLRGIEGKLAQNGITGRSLFFLPPAVDTRIENLPLSNTDAFKPVYLGNPIFFQNSTAFSKDITVLDASTPERMADSITSLGAYNFHYGLRDPGSWDPLIYKPFTKGINAAFCGAHILVSRDIHDAEYLLGKDYPYFVEGTTPEQISTTLDFAHDSFGSPEWHNAFEVLTQLRAQTTSPAVAETLLTNITPLLA